MLKIKSRYCTAIVATALVTTSCSAIVRKEEPTLSHVHIGHAITGWEAAPDKQGLLVAAELYAIEAKAYSDLLLASAKRGNLSDVREYLAELTRIVDPSVLDKNTEAEFGLRRLTAEAMLHLEVASEIFDASDNVRRTMARTNVKGQGIVNNLDELIAFLSAARDVADNKEAMFFAEEISMLMDAITGEPDEPETYGIQGLMQDIDAMVEREDPPYQTIDKLYLFSIGV